MQRKTRDYFILSLKGMAMGAADTVPGVSGGTIAFITGIYEELVTSLSKIDLSLLKVWKDKGFSSVWKEVNGNFFLALFSGVGISIFSLMRFARYALENHPLWVWAFFFGLVLASIWYVGKQIKSWNFKILAAALIAALCAYLITRFPALHAAEHSSLFLFFAGALAICAMILPGISGAYILLLLGAYEEVTVAVSEFDIKKLLVLALGIGVGLLSFSRLLKWLFNKYEQITLAALTGFIAGSLNKIWPWKKVINYTQTDEHLHILAEKSVLPWHYTGYPRLVEHNQQFEVVLAHRDPQIWYVILFFILGFLLIFLLEFLAKKTVD